MCMRKHEVSLKKCPIFFSFILGNVYGEIRVFPSFQHPVSGFRHRTHYDVFILCGDYFFGSLAVSFKAIGKRPKTGKPTVTAKTSSLLTQSVSFFLYF